MLHHSADARSFRVLWALEELGLPYRLRMWPFPPRALAREYLAENPLGTVPLLVDGEVRITESVAACQYLASRHAAGALSVEPGEAAYGAYLNALHFGEATLTFPQAIVLRYGRFEPPERRVPQAVADYGRWFGARLRGLDAMLAGGADHLCAGRFTMADVSVGYALMLAEISGLDAAFSPAVAAYWDRLRVRRGFRAALAAQDRAGREQGVVPTDLRADPEAPR